MNRYNKNTYYKVINTRCDPEGTYDFDPTKKVRIGHLLKMSFSSVSRELENDTAVCDPENPENKVKIVGAFDYIRWLGNEKIEFACRISPKNKGIMQEAMILSSRKLEIEAEWVIYEYDHHEQKYFQRFHTNKKPILFEIIDDIVHLEEDINTSIKKPMNFEFDIALTARNGIDDQELSLACSASGHQFKRQFGC